MIELSAEVATLTAFFAFIYRRLLRYLHIYQQEEYDSWRFACWMINHRAFDKRVTLTLTAFIALWLLSPIQQQPSWMALSVVGALFIAFAYNEANPCKVAKKPLVMTKRAWRIMALALGLATISAILWMWLAPLWGFIAAVQLAPFYLIAGNWLLQPFETRTQRYYWTTAHQRLKELKPIVIGITGSFGKTSVKHMLGHVLTFKAPTHFTPGSVNTLMGVARVIRESLPEYAKHFVVEMGAYGVGSIAALCELAPPQFGIITAIGEAHYERFKNIEAVARAKFELATAVLKLPAGVIFVHSSVLNYQYPRDFVTAHRHRFVICGEDERSDLRVVSWRQLAQGLHITVAWQGIEYNIEVPIYGAQHVGNVALIFAVAATLEMKPENILAALRTTPQTKHRLEVKQQPNGIVYINDAYNSNPTGFAAGLQLLTFFSREGSQRILVTPGMVELGKQHENLHRQLGLKAAEHVDQAIVVLPQRIPTFVEGFLSKKSRSQLVEVNSFAEANRWLHENVRPNDVVLLENDLPDLYESTLSL